MYYSSEHTGLGLAISVCRLLQTDLGTAEDYWIEGESQHLLNVRCSSHFTDTPCLEVLPGV